MGYQYPYFSRRLAVLFHKIFIVYDTISHMNYMDFPWTSHSIKKPGKPMLYYGNVLKLKGLYFWQRGGKHSSQGIPGTWEMTIEYTYIFPKSCNSQQSFGKFLYFSVFSLNFHLGDLLSIERTIRKYISSNY